MRSVLAVAILALPSLVFAQAVHSMSHLLASAEAPAYAFQAGAIRADMPRVFTGLIAPIRVTSLQLLPSSAQVREGEVDVTYTVDTAGVPQNIQMVKPLNEAEDRRVVEAVRKIRYTPGQLDGLAVAMPVTLHISFKQ